MSRELLQQVGQIVQLIDPDSFASDGAGGSDTGRVSVGQHKGCLFVVSIGDVSASVSGKLSLVYSATGSVAGSDYAELAGATDFITADTDTANSVRLLDVAFDDGKAVVAAGKFAASLTGDSDGTIELGVVAIPYGGNVLLPIGQANTVIET